MTSLRGDLSVSRRTVGIIGGLGPQATADLFRKIIDRTPAAEERDHLHIVVDNQPDMPSRYDAIIGRGPSPVPRLIEVAQNLERGGADFLVMPCNTAHAFAAEIQSAVSIPLVNMIEVTCDAPAARPDVKAEVGLLAAEGCLAAGLYQEALARRGIVAHILAAQDLADFMTAISRVKLGRAGPEEHQTVRRLGDRLIGRGAEALIAACTEVPLLVGADDFACPLFDSTALLADAAVAMALGSHADRAPISDSYAEPS